ncbi:MAG TPA: hypothetical protein VHG72_08605 [Polyangia bacterium]|nr:hypothetical protein [Polyangia bacterium]
MRAPESGVAGSGGRGAGVGGSGSGGNAPGSESGGSTGSGGAKPDGGGLDGPGGKGGQSGAFGTDGGSVDGLGNTGGSTTGAAGGNGAGGQSGIGGANGIGGGAPGGSGGGTGGQAGRAGTGGIAGAGGNASCTPGVNPTTALLTGFTSGTDWSSGTGTWGSAGNLQGVIYAYAGAKSGIWQAAVDSGAGVLDIGGTTSGGGVGPGTVMATDYAGGGLRFDQCVNTTSWTGVQFRVGGTAGNCELYFQIKTFAEQPIASGGGCAANCYDFPQVKVQVSAQPITVQFRDLVGGKPDGGAAIAMQILGLEWQINGTNAVSGSPQTCTNVELTIDNVQLVE